MLQIRNLNIIGTFQETDSEFYNKYFTDSSNLFKNWIQPKKLKK